MSRAIFAVAFAALAAVAVAAPSGLETVDKTILNFALNLEYLEANFYSCAAYGKVLNRKQAGDDATLSVGCPKNAFKSLSRAGRAYAISIALDEIAHVVFIRTVLGDDAVAQPLINIGDVFAGAADAAATNAGVKLPPGGLKFNAYGNDILFYHAAFIFEDVGVTAYKGAAALIKSKVVLEAAAGILAVEAYHGGAIRTLLLNVDPKIMPFGLPVPAIVQAISDLRGAVGGGKDQGLYKTDKFGKPVIPILAPGDANAIAFSRLPTEVLNIVYLGQLAKGKGGFYPNGVTVPTGSKGDISILLNLKA